MQKLIVTLFLMALTAMPALASSVVRRVACYARNDHGITFEAVGTFAPKVESSVLGKCYSYGSRSCHATGCRIVYLRQGS